MMPLFLKKKSKMPALSLLWSPLTFKLQIDSVDKHSFRRGSTLSYASNSRKRPEFTSFSSSHPSTRKRSSGEDNACFLPWGPSFLRVHITLPSMIQALLVPLSSFTARRSLARPGARCSPTITLSNFVFLRFFLLRRSRTLSSCLTNLAKIGRGLPCCCRPIRKLVLRGHCRGH